MEGRRMNEDGRNTRGDSEGVGEGRGEKVRGKGNARGGEVKEERREKKDKCKREANGP